MPDIRTALIVDLAGNLVGRSRGFGQAMTGLSRTGVRSFNRLGRAASMAGGLLDRAGNRYVALATGAAGIGAARGVVTLQRRFTRLGRQANISADQVAALKKEIFDTAQAPDIRVDPSEITSAFEAIVEKTGDLKFARDNIGTIARAIQATGGQGHHIGSLIAEFKKLDQATPDELLRSLDTLIVQGKAGAFPVAALATQGERLFSAYAATGRVGPKAVREIGAIIQVAKQGVGSYEQAATAFEAVIRELQNVDKIKFLRDQGIEVFEKGQPGVMRNVADIMKEIVKTASAGLSDKESVMTRLRKAGSQELFGDEALRAFNNLVAEYQNTGGFGSMDKFLAIQATGAELMKDSAIVADDAAGAMQNLSTAFQQFADNELTGPIQDLADAFNSLDSAQVKEIMGALKTGAIAGGGLILASKAIRTIADVRGAFGRRGGAGGGLGGIAAAATPVPVFVTNPGFGGAGQAGGGGRHTKPGRRVPSFAGNAAPSIGAGANPIGAGARPIGRFSRGLGRIGGRALPFLGLGLGALHIGQAAAAGDVRGASRAGGGLAGAFAGAAIGQAAIPIPVVGGIIGAILGGLGGDSLGDLLGGKLEIAIKSDQPVSVTRLESNGKGMDIEVDAGMTTMGSGA